MEVINNQKSIISLTLVLLYDLYLPGEMCAFDALV